MLHCLIQPSPAGVNGRQIIKRHLLLLTAPGRLEKRVIRFFRTLLQKQIHAQHVIAFTVVRIRIPHRQALDCLAEISFRFTDTASTEQKLSIRLVDPDIPRISLQSFQVIRIRKISRMTVLLNMLTGQKQLFIRHDFGGILRSLCGIRNMWNFFRLRPVFCKTDSLTEHTEPEILFLLSLPGNFRPENIVGGQTRLLIQKDSPPVRQNNSRIFPYAGGIYDNLCRSLSAGKMDSRVLCGVFHLSHCFIWHKILTEHLFLERLQPCKIRLIVRIYACHQFHIRPVFIRKIPVPCLSEISASPGPLLLSRRNMMIRHMEDTGFPAIIISADKIIF